jgi:glutamate/tyrosine decarboxylase-like PLP-dependent enzyme
MTPGGSFANFMGIHLSRTRLHPDFNKKGLYGYKPMKIFTSDVSHYSVKKGVNFCGLGTENIVSIKTDNSGRMIPLELEKAI